MLTCIELNIWLPGESGGMEGRERRKKRRGVPWRSWRLRKATDQLIRHTPYKALPRSFPQVADLLDSNW